MKSGRTLVDLAQELERQLATKQDLVVPSSLLQCHTDEGGELQDDRRCKRRWRRSTASPTSRAANWPKS